MLVPLRFLVEQEEQFVLSEQCGTALCGPVWDTVSGVWSQELQQWLKDQGGEQGEAAASSAAGGGSPGSAARRVLLRQHQHAALQLVEEAVQRRLQLLSEQLCPVGRIVSRRLFANTLALVFGRPEELLRHIARMCGPEFDWRAPIDIQQEASAAQGMLQSLQEQLLQGLLENLQAGAISHQQVKRAYGGGAPAGLREVLWQALGSGHSIGDKHGHWGLLLAVCRVLALYVQLGLVQALPGDVQGSSAAWTLVKALHQQVLLVSPTQAVAAEVLGNIRAVATCLAHLVGLQGQRNSVGPELGLSLLDSVRVVGSLRVLLVQRELAASGLQLLDALVDGSADCSEVFAGSAALLAALLGLMQAGGEVGQVRQVLRLVRVIAEGSVAVQEAVVGVAGAAAALVALLGHSDGEVAGDAAETFAVLQRGSEQARRVLMEAASGAQLQL